MEAKALGSLAFIRLNNLSLPFSEDNVYHVMKISYIDGSNFKGQYTPPFSRPDNPGNFLEISDKGN